MFATITATISAFVLVAFASLAAGFILGLLRYYRRGLEKGFADGYDSGFLLGWAKGSSGLGLNEKERATLRRGRDVLLEAQHQTEK